MRRVLIGGALGVLAVSLAACGGSSSKSASEQAMQRGATLTGKQQIRRFWLAAPAFQPDNRWVSDTAAYKIRITVNGDRGTLHFECHYIDSKTRKLGPVTAADQQVARINGSWLITDMVGGSATLTP